MARTPVAVGFALVLAASLTGAWLAFGESLGVRHPALSGEPRKLVVLPFTNLGGTDDAYFADGITDEITARLTAIKGLRLIGSRSARAYKGKALAEIGRLLGVEYVLDGSVRWQKASGGATRVRVTLHLVSTVDGAQRWAEVYDEPLDEIFRVHSEIAQKVVRALDVTIGADQRRAVDAVPTRSVEAYDYYLRGNDYSRRGTEQRFVRATVRMFERAVELDSGFALAYAGLARAHNQMHWMHWDHSDERRALVKRAVDRAFELEPGLPEAHLALGAYYTGGLDYERGLQEYERAAVERPFLAASAIAVLRAREGRFQESLLEFEKALRLDPADVVVITNYAHAHDLLREFPRAETLYDRATALAPERSNPYSWKAGLYLRWDGRTERARGVLDEEARTAGVVGDPLLILTRVLVDVFDRRYDNALARLTAEAPEAISDQYRFIPRAELRAQIQGLKLRPDLERAYYDSARLIVLEQIREQAGDPRLHSALGIAYAGLGHKQEAIRQGKQGVALLPVKSDALRGFFRVWDLARIYTMVGEYDLAIDRLEYLLSIPGYLTVPWLRIDPTWNALRGHPRFQRLLDRGGSP